jgi:hypothetical protein
LTKIPGHFRVLQEELFSPGYSTLFKSVWFSCLSHCPGQLDCWNKSQNKSGCPVDNCPAGNCVENLKIDHWVASLYINMLQKSKELLPNTQTWQAKLLHKLGAKYKVIIIIKKCWAYPNLMTVQTLVYSRMQEN